MEQKVHGAKARAHAAASTGWFWACHWNKNFPFLWHKSDWHFARCSGYQKSTLSHPTWHPLHTRVRDKLFAPSGFYNKSSFFVVLIENIAWQAKLKFPTFEFLGQKNNSYGTIRYKVSSISQWMWYLQKNRLKKFARLKPLQRINTLSSTKIFFNIFKKRQKPISK